MSMFLFQVINLAPHAFAPADLLLAVCLLVALCAWLGLEARTFALDDNLGENRIRVYRHLWNSLERVYRELQDGGGASDAAMRRHWREVYAFFLKNGRVIEPGDWLVVREYIVILQQLRFVNGHERSAIGKATSQTLSRPSMRCATQALEANQLRSAVRQLVRRIVPSG